MRAKLLQLLAIWLWCGACNAQNLPIGKTQRDSTPIVVDGIGRILQVEVCGSGRFFVLRLEDSRLAIFDLVPNRIIGHVPLPSAEAVIAGGKNVLVVIDPQSKQLERWSIRTLEKQSESTLDIEFEVGHAAIGAATDGPLLLIPKRCRWPLEEVRLLSLATLKPVVDEIDLVGRVVNSPDGDRPAFARASDDGTTFCVGPAGLLLRVESDRVIGRFCTEIDWKHTMQPGRLGRYLYGCSVPLDQSNSQARSKSIEQTRLQGVAGQISIHDRGGPFYLSMRPTADGSGLEAFYMTQGEDQPLGKVPGFVLPTGEADLLVSDRVHLHSRAGVIATVDGQAGRVSVHRIRPSDLLPPSDPRRLSLISPSELTVHAGQAFAHRIQVVGRADETEFDLIGGPTGMTVDESGVLRWLPPKLDKDMTFDVGLRTSLGGNTKLHRLVIKIRAAATSKDGPAGTARDRVAPERASAKLLHDSRTIGGLTGRGLAERHDEPITLKVGTNPGTIRPAAEGQLLVFREPDSISILSTALARLVAQLPAPHTGTQFATGRDCIVVHDPVDRTLTRWRLDNLSVSHQVRAPFDGEARLMLLGASSSGPLLVEARESSDMYMFDSESLELLPFPPIRYPNVRLPNRSSVLGIAENGTTLSATRYNDLVSLVPVGTEYRGYAHRQTQRRSAKVSHDGRYFYTGSSVFDRYWRPQDSGVSSGSIFPAVAGPFLLSVSGEKYNLGSSFRRKYAYRIHVDFHLRGFSESLSTLKNLPLIGPQKYLQSPNVSREQIWFVPTVNRLVRFDPRTIEFVFHYWDVDSALDRFHSLRPVIVSSPRIWVRRGRLWSYQLDALPRGKIAYRMPVAPDGMELSEQGRITWNVPPDLAKGRHSVVVIAESEYGKEENHAFELLVLR